MANSLRDSGQDTGLSGLSFISKEQGWTQQSLRLLLGRLFGTVYCHRKNSEATRNIKILTISSKQGDSGNRSIDGELLSYLLSHLLLYLGRKPGTIISIL